VYVVLWAEMWVKLAKLQSMEPRPLVSGMKCSPSTAGSVARPVESVTRPLSSNDKPRTRLASILISCVAFATALLSEPLLGFFSPFVKFVFRSDMPSILSAESSSCSATESLSSRVSNMYGPLESAFVVGSAAALDDDAPYSSSYWCLLHLRIQHSCLKLQRHSRFKLCFQGAVPGFCS
jgi:hypothetical protein